MDKKVEVRGFLACSSPDFPFPGILSALMSSRWPGGWLPVRKWVMGKERKGRRGPGEGQWEESRPIRAQPSPNSRGMRQEGQEDVPCRRDAGFLTPKASDRIRLFRCGCLLDQPGTAPVPDPKWLQGTTPDDPYPEFFSG